MLAMAGPAERMRAYAELSRVLAEEGEAMPPEIEGRLLRSLDGRPERRREEETAMEWAVERRRLVLLHTLRPIAAAGCAVAAALPFAVAAWRWGRGVWDAAVAFLTPGRPLVGVALAVLAAGFLARRTAHADSLEGLAGLVAAGFVAGAAALAVALGRVF